jgi:hypothetical protein
MTGSSPTMRRCYRRLFNASLEGNDIRDGDTISENALKALVRAAVALTRFKARP